MDLRLQQLMRKFLQTGFQILKLKIRPDKTNRALTVVRKSESGLKLFTITLQEGFCIRIANLNST